MAKSIKTIITILMVLIMICGIALPVFAAGEKEDGSDFQPSKVVGNTSGTGDIQTLGNSIVGILQVIGILVSVIVLIVLGIKYMMGSAEEKAEYKKTMIPYLIGAVLIFTASALAQAIYNFATGVSV